MGLLANVVVHIHVVISKKVYKVRNGWNRSGLALGRLYLADHGSADHVIRMLNSILSTGKYLYPSVTYSIL